MTDDEMTAGDLLVDEQPTGAASDPDGGEWEDWGLEADGDADEGPPEDPGARARRERFIRRSVDAFVVAACALFVFANLHPQLVLSSAVPAGGDMGAHVWGPAFLRDHLLPAGRLSGWTPDWYAGFPAYQFYMVIPSLLIVALDVGIFGGWTMVLPIAMGIGLAFVAWRAGSGWTRRGLVVLSSLVIVLGVELPYGTAFKLVTIVGVVTLPVASYAFGRLADLPFPGPAMLSIASIFFLFDRNFTIYGGNVASTLAGEFAFSISLSLAVLYLGVVIRGLRTGRHRATAAVLLALTGLCHLIPAFFALAGTAVIAGAPLIADGGRALWQTLRATGATVLAAWRRPGTASWISAVAATLLALLVAPFAAVWRLWKTSMTFQWVAAVLPIGGLISAFWVLPFVWQKAYVNDMGWQKLPYQTAENGMRSWSGALFTISGETYWKYLVPRTSEGMPVDLRWVLALACMGVVLSIAFKVKTGIYLAVLTLLMGAAFVLLPEYRLWNARLLPFYYLGLYFLAAIGIAEIGRTLAVLAARDPDRPSVVGPAAVTGAALLASMVVIALPLRALPGGQLNQDSSYSWLGLTNGAGKDSFVRGWARWNYTGYEGKPAYAEYRDLILTMQQVGEEHGCGRSFWEYEKELNRYGTPMALMLLPHWTDGCIGSMEGLFFEASATTPFHFLTQVELSTSPSAAQRDLPYAGFDGKQGVEHLQLLGVRYYLATSVQATQVARNSPDLTELATSGPWTIFLVADSDLVAPLENEPAVLDGVDDHQEDWICRSKADGDKCDGPAVRWFTNPDEWDVMWASSGPDSWQRVDVDDPDPIERPLPPVAVTEIEAGTDSISFSVDEVGVPVLVKASYFPNWRVSGGDGPYRVAPNLMVVVPTEEHVELTYGREPVELVGWGMTAVGIGLAVLVANQPALVPRGRREDEGDDLETIAGDVAPGEPPSPRHLSPG